MKLRMSDYPYASKRTAVYGKNGMVCSGNPSASNAGLDILKRGGNAIDAAIAVAASMPVVEPTCNGLGSDCFAIIYFKEEIFGLNASGRSPQSISIKALKDRGLESIPSYGIVPIGTPGAVGGWMKLYERFGQLSLEEIFQPAIEFAEQGFPVSPTIARLWQDEVEKYSPYKADSAFQGFFETFTIEGEAPKAGQIFRNQDIARTLSRICSSKGKDFYQGELAQKISDFIASHKGFLQKADLESYGAFWVDPISTHYRGIDVWELPPNGHGISVLMALEILEGFDFSKLSFEERVHLQIEALKLAMTDAAKYVTDPKYMSVSVEQLLSKEYSTNRRNLIGKNALSPKAGLPHCPSTVYFATADKEGNMVSMIQSNYRGFGSGIVVPGTGISLNDRVENFSFDPNHDNSLEGNKLPYHTIIPGFLTKNKKALGPFGVMGGFMQPQGQLQVAMNMIDFALNPQAALDAPRFQWQGKKEVQLESDFPLEIVEGLEKRGHSITIIQDSIDMGRGQVILKMEDGSYCGGTEKRTDGSIASF